MTKPGLGGSKKSNVRHQQNDSKKIFNHLNTPGNVTNQVLSANNSGNNLGNSTDSDDQFAPVTIQKTIEMLEKSKFTTRLLEH